MCILIGFLFTFNIIDRAHVTYLQHENTYYIQTYFSTNNNLITIVTVNKSFVRKYSSVKCVRQLVYKTPHTYEEHSR